MVFVARVAARVSPPPKRYEAYKAATTVGEYLSLGGLKADVKFDYQRSYLAVVDLATGRLQWAEGGSQGEGQGGAQGLDGGGRGGQGCNPGSPEVDSSAANANARQTTVGPAVAAGAAGAATSRPRMHALAPTPEAALAAGISAAAAAMDTKF